MTTKIKNMKHTVYVNHVSFQKPCDDLIYKLPFSPNGKEGVRVLSVELKGFSYIRPAHGARRQAASFVCGLTPLPLQEEKPQQHRNYNNYWHDLMKIK